MGNEKQRTNTNYGELKGLIERAENELTPEELSYTIKTAFKKKEFERERKLLTLEKIASLNAHTEGVLHDPDSRTSDDWSEDLLAGKSFSQKQLQAIKDYCDSKGYIPLGFRESGCCTSHHRVIMYYKTGSKDKGVYDCLYDKNDWRITGSIPDYFR